MGGQQFIVKHSTNGGEGFTGTGGAGLWIREEWFTGKGGAGYG